jgi:hypothetical protein
MRRIKFVSGAVCVIVLTAAGISPASAQMLDRAGTMCGQAIVTAKFQQEEGKREVDVEVYSTARGERWRIEIRAANGKVLHRISRTTGRDAAFDVWRYVPPNTKSVEVKLSGPASEDCSIDLTAN